MNRKKNVDQAIRNGQALLKQTTGKAGAGRAGQALMGSGKCLLTGRSVQRRLPSLRAARKFPK